MANSTASWQARNLAPAFLAQGDATNVTNTSPAANSEVVQASFVADATGSMTVEEDFGSISGGGAVGLSVGTAPNDVTAGAPNPIGNFAVLNTNNNRLNVGNKPRQHTFNVVAGTTYYIGAYPGAGQTVTNYTLKRV